MERQAGLGRSLEDVLDSLAPVEPDPTAPGRVLFEPEDLERQLDQLMGDITALRERVQHLVGMVPDDAVLQVAPGAGGDEKKHEKNKKKHSSKGQKKSKGEKKHKKKKQ
jgi:hypothetical protein